MNTQKLTHAGMLSAMVVAMTMFVKMIGLGYTLFLDLGLPVLVGLIYLKCDLKYTSLCGMISISIIFFGLGDLPTAIWMIQSILIGIICAKSLRRDSIVMDDILGCSVWGAFIIIFVDMYFEKILGVSLIKELWQMVETFPAPEGIKEVTVSIALASLPVGTCIVTYLCTLLIGGRLNLLSKREKQKLKVIKNMKRYAGYLCCSKQVTNRWIIYLIVIQFLKEWTLPIYIQTVLNSVQWIVLYFILRDAYSFVSQYIYARTKSLGITKGIGLGVLIFLIRRFKLMTLILTLAGYLIDKIYYVREKQIKILESQIA